MQHVDANGCRINYRLAGDPGQQHAALCIHGLNANLAFWRPEVVRMLGAERSLLMYDLRGHGLSGLPASGYTPSHHALDAAGLLDAVNLDAVDVVAHSFGAIVALHLARIRPGSVRSLTLLDPRCRLFQPDLRLGDWSSFERWRGVLADTGIEVSPETPADHRLSLTLSTIAVGEASERLAASGFFAPSRGRRSAEKYRRLLTETTAADELSSAEGLSLGFLQKLDLPTQLIYGDSSMFLPSRDGLLRTLPCCRSTTLTGVGHNFPFLRPTDVSEIVLDFWAGSTGARSAAPRSQQPYEA